MTRRGFAIAAAAASVAAAPPKSQLGIATTCYLSYLRPRDAHQFLEFCHERGAGGIQAPLPAEPARFRARAEQLGMYYEAMFQLQPDVDAMREQMRRAREAGASAGRVGCLGGRRYETFATLEEWKKFVADSRAKITATAKAAEAEKFFIGMENHKDWTLEDALALMKEFGGEYFGILLDTGNNISLLDDPYELVEKLAPYTLLTHLKDMAWQDHASGFEMSEMVFGEGSLDMKRIIGTIRGARPKTRMVLEMITRNPLVVPCLTPKYWATMPNRGGLYLAGTLNAVKQIKARQPLPRMDHLDQAAKLRLEDDNVKWCLNVAREKYGL
jgi:sugar phosphate isomerase/epimerase